MKKYGSIIEAKAVTNANSTLATGVIVGAATIVNHNSFADDGYTFEDGM